MGEKGAIVDAFVDRTEELAALEEQFADHQAAMVVIYGRRRIGKTALITGYQQLPAPAGVFHMARHRFLPQ